MTKAKQRSSSAAQRREEVKKQRQQRIAPTPSTQSRSPNNERRRRQGNQLPWGLLVGAVFVIVAFIGVFFYLSHQQPSNSGITTPTPTSASVLQAVTHVSPTVLAAVGTGGQNKALVPLKGGSGSATPPFLTGPTDKPEIFYAGAEYCPYCAAERWAMVVALSRFGTFSKLYQTTSSASDVYPNTPSFTFYHSEYTSQYIDFVSLEETTNQPDGSGGYTLLQTPTADQQKLINTYDAPPYLSNAGSIPFIDIANQYVMQGANYNPQLLANHSWDDIARQLSDKNSDTTKAIVGSANYLTAAICIATKQQPASVCTAAPIPQIEQSLGKTALNAGNIQASLAFHPFDMLVPRQD
jgi:thiol-disulfide isomerase/thioredoxin